MIWQICTYFLGFRTYFIFSKNCIIKWISINQRLKVTRQIIEKLLKRGLAFLQNMKSLHSREFLKYFFKYLRSPGLVFDNVMCCSTLTNKHFFFVFLLNSMLSTACHIKRLDIDNFLLMWHFYICRLPHF